MSRAQVSVTVYFRIFEIILLVMVIGIVATEIKNAEKGGTYDKKFFSRDIALIMDSLTNARGNVIYIYNPPNADLNRFEIDFSNNAVNVGGDQWQYAVNKNLKLTAPLKGKYPTLAIKKSGNNLWVEQGGPRETLINGYLLECPAANMVVDSLIIDPGHGFNPITNDGSRGFAGEPKDAKGRQVPESELVLKISAALQSQASIKGITKVIGTRSLDTNIISLPNLGDFIAE
jgi:N-acetylmuramoyl-L-alanine amidase